MPISFSFSILMSFFLRSYSFSLMISILSTGLAILSGDVGFPFPFRLINSWPWASQRQIILSYSELLDCGFLYSFTSSFGLWHVSFFFVGVPLALSVSPLWGEDCGAEASTGFLTQILLHEQFSIFSAATSQQLFIIEAESPKQLHIYLPVLDYVEKRMPSINALA